ncbi:MAG: uroporphyrinogen-III synthase, partial [Mediterranea sp.]|nr:uroporphyrinogen-III synthase [Mediterranea sp.]
MKETCLSLLVTAPEAYAARLMEALKSADHVGGVSFRPLSVPLIETVIPKTNDAVAQLLERLDDVDYLAFSSRKAIESLALQLERNERVLPARVKCCAIGKDNEYLTERLGIAPAF